MTEYRYSATATSTSLQEPGPLTRKVVEYDRVMQRLVPVAKSMADWAPLAEFVAVNDFRRVGCFLEVHDWQQYLAMLLQWVAATGRFKTTVRRISELPGVVYYEIEERHIRADGTNMVVNSMTAFGFNPAGRIRSLDVYLQQRMPG
jgi:hypothetical protein